MQGKRPVHTGVTMVIPRGKASVKAVNGGFFHLNGNGEMTGQSYLQDFGLVYGPIGISNTNAIGPVYTGITEWSAKTFGNAIWPVVAETRDGRLNDIEGLHVKQEHAIKAIEVAKGGAVQEGNVGGGTGWCASASRVASVHRHACSRSTAGPIPWVCWCNATPASVTPCV